MEIDPPCDRASATQSHSASDASIPASVGRQPDDSGEPGASATGVPMDCGAPAPLWMPCMFQNECKATSEAVFKPSLWGEGGRLSACVAQAGRPGEGKGFSCGCRRKNPNVPSPRPLTPSSSPHGEESFQTVSQPVAIPNNESKAATGRRFPKNTVQSRFRRPVGRGRKECWNRSRPVSPGGRNRHNS